MKKIKLEIGWRLYSLVVTALIVLGIAGFTYAYGGVNPSVHGHNAGELEVDLSDVCMSDGTNCAVVEGSGPLYFEALKASRGTSVAIPERDIIDYCGDKDGCELRFIMYDWDGNKRSASRSTLLYYNVDNKNWRDSDGDSEGTNNNGPSQHIAQSWSCYFTDGKYEAWSDKGDSDLNFGLFSWNEYNADCRLFIYD